MIRMIWAVPVNDYKPMLFEVPGDGREIAFENLKRNVKGDTVKLRRISTDFFIQEKDLPAIINWYGMEKLWKVVGDYIEEEHIWEWPRE